MRKTVVINAVGLTQRLLSAGHMPRAAAFAQAGRLATVGPVLPAVTCSVQSTYLTGVGPSEHGIVGNGWYDRAECEIKFWKQSDKLVQRPRLWDLARQRALGRAGADSKQNFTAANICWWYAMHSSLDYTITPRPMYLADGRKLPDIWTNPPDLRRKVQAQLGQFPLFKFWGPGASIESTQWIADAAIYVDQQFDPTLTLIYLPHLDYSMQRLGIAAPQDVRELDDVIGQLLTHYSARGARIILLSEYGITPVSRPVHLNRVLRENRLITTRTEMGHELLDAGASAAFAVADHQIAHVYVNNHSRIDSVAALLEKTPGVARVLREDGKRQMNIAHDRAGDLVCLAEPDSWFTYYYWNDDKVAPDFARTVNIHRKPGYDPAELFIDPKLPAAKLTIALKLLARKLGFRTLLDVIPLDATLVKGSHGLPPRDPADGAMVATSEPALLDLDALEATEVMALILRHLASPECGP